MKQVKIFLLIMLSIFAASLSAQELIKKSIGILPFSSFGLDYVNVQTAEKIFRFELQAFPGKEIVIDSTGLYRQHKNDCFDLQCASKFGRIISAENVVCVELIPLGSKIIVQYFVVDVQASKEILRDRTTALSVEDLEMVMKRVARSVALLIPIDERVEVGTITESEAGKPLLRGSTKNIGLSFGYLFPQNGYDDAKKSFVIDVRYGYELDNFDVGMLLAIRRGFAMNINSSYIFSKSDISPYLGGAFGFHWVAHDNFIGISNDVADGFEFSVRGGLRIFRTHRFQILLNLEYVYTINDYDDKALVFTIGIL